MTSNQSHDPASLRAAILDLLKQKPEGKSISPTEAARSIAGPDEQQWSRLMKPLRAVAIEMAKAGELQILRKNKPANPSDFRGVYRLALPPNDANGSDAS